MSRTAKLAITATFLFGLSGCMVVPARSDYYAPDVVVVRPVPRYAPPPHYAPPRYRDPYDHRHWR